MSGGGVWYAGHLLGSVPPSASACPLGQHPSPRGPPAPLLPLPLPKPPSRTFPRHSHSASHPVPLPAMKRGDLVRFPDWSAKRRTEVSPDDTCGGRLSLPAAVVLYDTWASKSNHHTVGAPPHVVTCGQCTKVSLLFLAFLNFGIIILTVEKPTTNRRATENDEVELMEHICL